MQKGPPKWALCKLLYENFIQFNMAHIYVLYLIKNVWFHKLKFSVVVFSQHFFLVPEFFPGKPSNLYSYFSISLVTHLWFFVGICWGVTEEMKSIPEQPVYLKNLYLSAMYFLWENSLKDLVSWGLFLYSILHQTSQHPSQNSTSLVSFIKFSCVV